MVELTPLHFMPFIRSLPDGGAGDRQPGLDHSEPAQAGPQQCGIADASGHQPPPMLPHSPGVESPGVIQKCGEGNQGCN